MSHLTVLNGAQGVNELLAGLASQDLSILELLRTATTTGNGQGPTAEQASDPTSTATELR